MMYHKTASSMQSSSQLLFERLINQTMTLQKALGDY